MKSNYLMKGLAVMAMGFVAVSCNKTDAFDPYAEQQVKQEEFTTNFQEIVLDGQTVDANQTWATTNAVVVSVTSDLDGTLKIYTNNPVGEIAAPLFTQDIKAGTLKVTVAMPADMETLYAALYAADGSVRVSEVVDGSALFKVPTESASSAARRVVKHGIDFPDAPDASEFATTIPGDAMSYTQYPNNGNNNSVHNYVLDETTSVQATNFWMGNFNLYVTGTKTIKWQNPGDGADNMVFYVLAGANLTITGDDAFRKNGAQRFKMYVADGATVTFEKGANSCIHMYNRGTVVFKGNNDSGIYGNGIIYNEGTMKFEGTNTKYQVVNPPYGGANVSSALGVWNQEGRFVNAGTLESKGLLLEGSGKFLNLGTANISGYTVVNSNDATWINEGIYTTEDYAYSAGSQNVWNNCKLTVNNLFAIWLGDSDVNAFQMDGGSSVITKDLKLNGPSRIKMGANSLLKVTNQAIMNCRNPNYGIYGPSTGDGYAVFQAKDVVSGHNSWESQYYQVSYGGQLYVASDTHFANGWAGQYPYFEQGANVKMYKGQANAPYSISSGRCNPGYNAGTPANNDPVMYYYYAFEDLGTTDDFDFNDVVIRVSAPVNGKSTVVLMAAGGIFPATVTYGSGTSIRNIGEEVHAAFGVSAGNTDDMVNTGGTGGKVKDFVELGTIENLSASTDMSALPIGLTVTGNNGQITKVVRSVANNGKAPLVIAVCGYTSGENAGKWFWAKERVNISSAYTQFGAWGANASSNTDWYKNYNDGVYKW